MQGGDISNQLAPRFVWVVEGLIIPEGCFRPPVAKKSRLRMRAMFADDLAFDQVVVDRMWQVLWRYDIRNEVVTFRPEEEWEPLQQFLDFSQVPHNHFMGASLQSFQHTLTHRLEIIKVFDPDRARARTYPSRRGIHVPFPSKLDPMTA